MRRYSVHTFEIGYPITDNEYDRIELIMIKKGIKLKKKEKKRIFCICGFEDKGIRLYIRKISQKERYNYCGKAYIVYFVLSPGKMLGYSIECLPDLNDGDKKNVARIFREEVKKYLGDNCVLLDLNNPIYTVNRIDVTADIIIPERKDMVTIFDVIRKTPLQPGWEHNFKLEALDTYVLDRGVDIKKTGTSDKNMKLTLYNKKEQLENIGHIDESKTMEQVLRFEVKLFKGMITEYTESQENLGKIFDIYSKAKEILVENVKSAFYKSSCIQLASLKTRDIKGWIEASDNYKSTDKMLACIKKMRKHKNTEPRFDKKKYKKIYDKFREIGLSPIPIGKKDSEDNVLSIFLPSLCTLLGVKTESTEEEEELLKYMIMNARTYRQHYKMWANYYKDLIAYDF